MSNFEAMAVALNNQVSALQDANDALQAKLDAANTELAGLKVTAAQAALNVSQIVKNQSLSDAEKLAQIERIATDVRAPVRERELAALRAAEAELQAKIAALAGQS